MAIYHEGSLALQDRLGVDLFTRVPRLEVPVFFFTGRHDHNTVSTLVEEWAAQLQAPHVEMVWFEDAGHYVLEDKHEVLVPRIRDFLDRNLL